MKHTKTNTENTITPKVSVILFVENDEQTVDKSIESLLKQTLSEIEIFAINQTFGLTFSKCASYLEKDPRIFLVSDKNTSLTNLLRLTNGDYVIISDTTKFFQNDAFEMLYYKAQATGADFVFSNYLKPDGKEAITQIQDLSSSDFSWSKIPDKILNLSPYTFSNKLYKTTFIQRLLKTAKECNILDESDFPSFAFVLAEHISYTQRVLMNYLKEDNVHPPKNWKQSAVSLLGLEFFLNRKTAYPSVERSFLNYALEKLFLLSNAPEPNRSMIQNYIVTEASPYFNFLDQPKTYYFDSCLWQDYSSLTQRQNLSSLLESFYFKQPEKIIPILIPVTNTLEINSVAVTLQSIKEHLSSDYFYDLYILGEVDSLQRRVECLTTDNLRVTYINITPKLPENLRKKYTSGFYVGLIPKLFSGYSKMLVLSPNTLIQSDLSAFLDIDLTDCIAAGSLDYSDSDYIEKNLGLVYNTYISAEVLWLNLDKCNEQNFSRPFFEQIIQKNHKKPFQDTINTIFKNKIMVLSPKYNALTHLIHQKNNVDYCSLEQEDAYILSYTEHPFQKNDAPFADRWWICARKSRFYEELLAEFLKKKLNLTLPIVAQKTVSKPVPNLPLTKEALENERYNNQKTFIKECLFRIFAFGQRRKLAKQRLEKMIKEANL